MILTVLGGSAAGGNPGQPCSGYLVVSDETRVALDLGSGTLPELRRHVDAATLDAIVISHVHLDHVLDLLAMRYFLAYSPDRTGRRIPLWMPPDGMAFLDRLALALQDDGDGGPYFSCFAIAEYDPAAPLHIGSLTLTFAPTVHYIDTWAIRAFDGRSTLVYTADTGPAADLAAFCAGADVLITEASNDAPDHEPWETRGHQTPEEAGNLATRAGIGTLVLSHLWSQFGFDRAAHRAATAFTGQILIARPGLRVEV